MEEEKEKEQQQLISVSEQLNLESLRSRAKDISDILTNCNHSSNQSSSEELANLLEDLKSQSIIQKVGFSDFDSLQSEDILDAYIKDAREQLSLVDAESSKIYDEMKTLTITCTEDSIQLERNLEVLNCSLKFLESQRLDKLHLGASVECSTSSNGSLLNEPEGHNFELMETEHEIEKKKTLLASLDNLGDILKRVQAVGQIEDTFTGLKVIEFDGSGIKFSLETFIPILDDFLCQQKMEFANNPATVVHELLVEVYDGTLELRNVEIFPNDIFIGEIFEDAKSSWEFCPSFPLQGIASSLQWLVEKIQDRIFLCTLRRLIVKDANKSRHSFEYSDRDGTVIAHMVNGIDAFIKLPYCWPLINSTLKLLSLKSTNNCTNDLPLSSFKVEEFGSSLDLQTQQNLVSFVDAIENALPQRR